MFFRKALVRIRKEYNQNPKRLFLYSGLSILVCSLFGVLSDFVLPFVLWGNLIRSLILIPTAISMFTFGYGVSLFMHYAKLESDPNWMPYRLRFSPSWRRRMSLIAAALMFVGIYANGFRIGYTIIASVFVALTIALFAFMRTTREESRREELNLPDSRDTRYERQMKKLEKARLESVRQKELRKKERRENLIYGNKKSQPDEE